MKEKLEQSFNSNNGLISLNEASRLYGFSHGYLKILIHRGKLEAFKKGRNWFTTKECLDKYLNSHPKSEVRLRDPLKSDFNVDLTSKIKNLEIDVFKKIASNFSSDIVKELKELRYAIKVSESKLEPKTIMNYFKNSLVSGLLARIDTIEEALIIDTLLGKETSQFAAGKRIPANEISTNQFVLIEKRLSIIEAALKEQNEIISFEHPNYGE